MAKSDSLAEKKCMFTENILQKKINDKIGLKCQHLIKWSGTNGVYTPNYVKKCIK
jgi:hypothetical protein